MKAIMTHFSRKSARITALDEDGHRAWVKAVDTDVVDGYRQHLLLADRLFRDLL
jgi:hypothetical protein